MFLSIYLVWRNKIKDSGTTHGFGDKLRGALFLYQYCNEKNINLKIDATDDICSDFLKNVVSTDYDKIKNQKIINVSDKSIEIVKETIQNNLLDVSSICVYTTHWPNDLNLTEDDKNFAKFICEPKNDIKDEVNEKIKVLPNEFGIQHFRFNDNVFKTDVDSTDKIFKKFFELLKKSYKKTDVLFTNSNNFKKYAKEQLEIKTVDCNDRLCKIEHIGESIDKESVKNSFIEFRILSKAKYIKSYTSYNWQSNFVHWPVKIYDIPFDHLYIDEKTLT